MNQRRLARVTLRSSLFAVLHSSIALAQNPVQWAGSATRPLSHGKTAPIQVTAAIAGGWHLYSLTQSRGGPVPTRITVADSQPFALRGAPAGPIPRASFDANFGIVVEQYEDRVTFSVPIEPSPSAPPGQDTVRVRVRYQVCNATLCLPPRTETVFVPVTIIGH